MDDRTIFLLRPCERCGRFFLMKREDQQFDTGKCRIEWNNRRRLREGDFRTRRKEQRERDLRQARKLKAAGTSAAEIQKKTGLGPRVLVKEGIFERDEV